MCMDTIYITEQEDHLQPRLGMSHVCRYFLDVLRLMEYISLVYVYINIKISQSQHVWKFSSNWKRGRAQEHPLTESLFCCESWVFLHSKPDTTVCKMELDAHAININES